MIRRCALAWPGLVAACFLAAAGCDRPEQAAGRRITVGVILPLSGSESRTGEEVLTGLELGRDSGGEIELRILDGKGEPAASARAFRQLADDPGVTVVVGGWFASTARTLAAVSRKTDLPFVALSPLAVGRSAPAPLSLHRAPALAAAAAVFARADLEALTAGIVEQGDSDIARELADAFEAAFSGDGAEVVWRARGATAEDLVWPPGPEPAVDVLFVAGPSSFAEAASSRSAKTRRASVLTTAGWEAGGLPALADGGVAVYTVAFFSATDPSGPSRRLLDACSRIGHEPSTAVAVGWDAVRLLQHAADRAPLDRGSVEAALRSGMTFSGATGRIEFPSAASPRETPAVSSLASGGPVFLRRVEVPSTAGG